MKIIKTLTIFLVVMMLFALCQHHGVQFMRGFCSKLDISEIVRAAEEYESYYEIEMKLSWDRLYNLDLYVTEPNGEIASTYNTVTASGGELGYYDSDGGWQYGDSGNNTAPEVYRVQYGLEGIYEINVLCNAYEMYTSDVAIADVGRYRIAFDMAGVTANRLYDVSANAFVIATFYGESEKETYLRFPESGTVEVASNVNDGWWDAGSFYFVPIAEQDYPWGIEDKTKCFIATATYGNSFEVELLQSFRDEYLSTNKLGRLFLKIYYKFSPPMARFVSKSSFLKMLVRAHLSPFVKLIRFLSVTPQSWVGK